MRELKNGFPVSPVLSVTDSLRGIEREKVECEFCFLKVAPRGAESGVVSAPDQEGTDLEMTFIPKFSS